MKLDIQVPLYLRSSRRGVGGLAAWQESRVAEHIVANAAGPLRVAELARLAGLSPSHFSRAFRASFGLSPYQMVSHHRVAEAMRLMLGTEWPLVEIANACGFVDQSHFSRRFRRQVSLSPGRWRRQRQSSPTIET